MNKTPSAFITVLVTLLLYVGLSPAQAQFFGDPNTTASVLLADSEVQPGRQVRGAFRLVMSEHWHTYWKNPGDVGLPTEAVWTLPEGFSVDEFQWPAPQFIETTGLVSYAYEDEVLLPFTLTVPESAQPGQTYPLKVKLSWLECKESCVPGEATLELTLKVGRENVSSPEAAEIEKAFENLPTPTNEVRAYRLGDKYQLVLPSGLNQDKTRFFPDTPEQLNDAAPQILDQTAEDSLLLTPDAEAKEAPQALSGILSDGEKSLIFEAPLTEAPVTAEPAGLQTVLLTAAAAFLGGIVLNLMPCVFPVLSLKVLGIVEQSNSEGRPAWHHGAVFTVGVLVSFWVMSGILLVVRAAGQGVGWGYHLQNPVMIGGLAVLFLLIGLNLFGVFEVGENLTQLSGVADKKEGFAHSFWSGVLTTLAATPCTAPFMGGAVGFALSQPSWVALSIFSALALGVAAPYMTLTLFPALLQKLPKPGAWMVTFKQILAFPMLLAVIWLVWVFGGQVGMDRMALLLLALLGVGFASWLYGKWGCSFEPTHKRLGLVFAGLAMLLSLYTGYQASQEPIGEDRWLAYTPELVEQLKAEGKPFFLDFTADWCTSCKANELVALSSSEVQNKFKDLDVTLVKADWTKKDEVITRALAGYGRAGVPLYVLYPGQGKDPEILPEVLIPGTVLAALDRVEKK